MGSPAPPHLMTSVGYCWPVEEPQSVVGLAPVILAMPTLGGEGEWREGESSLLMMAKDPGFGLVLASNTWLHCLQRQPLVETVDFECGQWAQSLLSPWFTEEMSACETRVASVDGEGLPADMAESVPILEHSFLGSRCPLSRV